MCGIFGMAGLAASFGKARLQGHVDFLFGEASSRGKDAAGMAFLDNGNKVRIIKNPIPASKFIRTKEYRASFSAMGDVVALFGHSRLVTNGSLEDNNNNQPVTYGGFQGIHNGIVANDDDLWRQNPDLERKFIVDTEALFAIMEKGYRVKGGSLEEAVENAFNAIEGNASIACFVDEQRLLLASNNGSLYFVASHATPAYCFASERHMVEEFISKRSMGDVFMGEHIAQLKPNSCVIIDTRTMESKQHELARNTAIYTQGSKAGNVASRELARSIIRRSEDSALVGMEESFNDSFVMKLRRCSQCLLPSTFPFIHFDNEGVCNFCHRHKKPELRGSKELGNYLSHYRSDNPNKPDCIVAVSGGRDSIYGLHYLKKEMGMNPIAYTYDWGMVTDIARRNIARVTGALGIEHVLVSADIRKKRAYVRKNLEAWLKRPSLGMIPLLMAGDKKFKYYGISLQQANGVDLAIYCAGNRFEKTDFKTGFCGIDEGETKGILSLSGSNTVKLLAYYGKEYLLNPRYLNASVPDTAAAYYYSYVMPKNYIYLFHYIDWDEEAILSTLTSQYNWEGAEDTIATWRIGDGTACFYNYLYYRVAGFTEFDTFRSNQIREGAMDRGRALEIVRKENRPRFRAIKTYLDLLGLDFEEVMKIVDQIPRLYGESL